VRRVKISRPAVQIVFNWMFSSAVSGFVPLKAGASMAANGVDALLVSVGSDLPYLTGYEAMPLERLTMLVVPRDGEATLVVPRLEAPRVVEQPGAFALHPWNETDDPVAIVA